MNPITDAGRAETGARALAFAQYASALYLARDGSGSVAEIFKARHPYSRYAELIHQKAAVSAMATTGDSAALAELGVVSQGFIEYLRPRTVLGRMSGFRTLPLNVRVPRSTAGVSAGWTGQGRPVPATSMSLELVTFPPSKIGGICVVTKELVTLSTPDAAALIREDLSNAVAAFSDVAFLDPSAAAVADVSPASITNGATAIPSTGSSAAQIEEDFKDLLAAITTNKTALYIVVHTDTALFLATLRTTGGNRVFPDIGVNGGSIMGVPAITTTSGLVDENSPGEKIIVAIDAAEILLNEGTIQLQASEAGTVELNSTPTFPADAATTLVSLWQHNLVAFFVQRYVNWERRRDGAVAYITGVAY